MTIFVRRSDAKPSFFSKASLERTATYWICCARDYTFVNERLAKHYGIPQRLWQPFPQSEFTGRECAWRTAEPGKYS